MKTSICIAMFALFIILSPVAFAKKFRQNDQSTNNNCGYVYSWYKKTKDKHAVFVTTGGHSPFRNVKSAGFCQAGGASTLREAQAYAISKCNREAKKRLKNPKPCKILESR